MGKLLRHHWPIALLLLAFVGLGSTYSIVNPLFEAPDELWHYRFAKYLADGQGLPVLKAKAGENVAGQEGGQPPLYYALVALATSWVDTSDIQRVSQHNPKARAQRPDDTAQYYNEFLHGPREDFPYRQTTLAVHLARGLSVLMGMSTVLLTYLIALEVFKRRSVALGAAALNAFIPQFLFISSVVNNDNLIILLSSLTLLLALLIVKRGISPLRVLLLAVAVAMAALTKLSGLLLLPLALAALGLLWVRQRSALPIRAGIVVLAAVVSVAGWWYARNWALYGDPLALGVFRTAAGATRLGIKPAALLEELEHVWISLWALFGWSNLPAEAPVYYFFAIISLLAVGSLLLSWRRGRIHLGAEAALLTLWLAAYTTFVLLWMFLVPSVQARLLFPAIPAISCLLAGGLASLPRYRGTSLALGLAVGLTLMLAVLAPFRYIVPAYPKPRFLSPAQAKAIPNQVEVDYGGQIRLLGYEVENPALQPGESLDLTLYWEALAPMTKDYTLFIHLLDPKGHSLGGKDRPLGNGVSPTSQWVVGTPIQETYQVPLKKAERLPTLVEVRLGLYHFPSLERLPAYDQQGRPLGTSVLLARVKATASTAPEPAIPHTVGVDLGGEVRLVGYQLTPREARPGGTIEGALYWRALRKLDRDYTVFVQLVGRNGLVAQYDAQPRTNTYPTSLWDRGELVEDEFSLFLTPQLTPGIYDLIAGMYNPVSGRRLAAGGQEYVLLTTVEVAPLPAQ
jgi:hypothetical protein